MENKYDVIIVGAGAGGISCAYNCGKLGLKTLLIEKNIHAGGLITSGLVTPVMKLNSMNINTSFYEDLLSYSDKFNARITYSDNNTGWFNPELLKIVFDSMLSEQNVDILYNSQVDNVKYVNDVFKISIKQNMLSLYFESTYLVDGTGNGKIFRELNLEILKDTIEKQSLSLRFIMGNVDCKKFSEWIKEVDSDENVTTTCNINGEYHFSTAYTWDSNKKWALAPYFSDAITNGVINNTDSAYFQIFTIPGMTNSVSFNCPKLIKENNYSKNGTIFEQSELIAEGRRRIFRIAEFCKKYLKGFENAYISNIADMLGERETVRVKGKHVFSVYDIQSGIKPQNIALASDYPIDIHSDDKDKGILSYIKHVWYLPLESLISEKYDNLFVVGRCLSADFKAQAAVRTQANCFSMGEAVAKHICSHKKAQNYLSETTIG